MSIKLSKRIERIPESVFTTMSRLAVENNAVNLGQGFPDFNGPDWLIEEVYNAMKNGKNQYAPSIGILSLRKNISELYKSIYDIDWSYEKEVIVTMGATEALFSAIHSVVDEGDEVIIFEPYYDSYIYDVLLAGGIPKFITLHKPVFSFNFDDLEKSITNKTKVIILNNPHNPTGKVYTKEELKFISEIAIKNDLIVISDEVYEFLTYDNTIHIPISTLTGMKERTITISSAGKTFGFTGWKIGWACANEQFIKGIHSIRQWTTFAVNTPCQHAVAFGLTKIKDYLPDFRKLYQKKRDFIIKELENSLFSPTIPLGSYFIMVNIPQNKNDMDLALELVRDYKVATIPPSVFYSISDEGKSMLRLCFAKQDETLKNGVKNLKAYKV
ncbi:MAG: aminotransferase class I/II-fold pyridoxal phosphate-dependent enzyme [Candidatus Kapabacteria bacterium]|nr:aminotransferase class I/II-fold pyridoxal phosphate-dependent enzyme [Candidatus Kapabacteria bacterium]